MAKDPAHMVAFQGVAGAHSDMACKEVYPYKETIPCGSFEAAFDVIRNGDATVGLIPIENSHAGRVAEIHNLLPNSGLSIVGEYFHKVRHHLMAPKGATLETIKTVYSHPQALMQCSKSVHELGFLTDPYFDTAGAAEEVARLNDPSKAALASNLAADLYGLEIVKENLQDADDNTTLFVSLAVEPVDVDPESTAQVLTSVVFTTRNIAAGLYKALGGFATNGVNILKLESYIPDYTKGTAQFFITFEGHPQDAGVAHALEELGFFTSDVKLLGIYTADPARYKG
jgi:prephenate dehydratase